MGRFLLAAPILFLLLLPVQAQQTPPLVSFTPHDLELRRVGDRWQLRAGPVVLKDLGVSETDARAALRLLRDLRVNQHGTIGTPEPVIEYWLSDGQAPPASRWHLGLTAIDLATLQVVQLEGHWCLRDDRQLLFHFGPHEQDARQALEVIQRYGFNRVGVIGMPMPVLMYFLAGSESTLSPQPKPDSRPQPTPIPLKQVLFPRQLSLPKPLAYDSATGGERWPLDWRQVQLRREGQRVKLVHGNYCLADFGTNEMDAREALRLFQHYRFTEQCRVGASASPLTFFLVNGQAPRGLCFGVQGTAFQPERLNVRQLDGRWLLCEGERPLLPAGTSEAEARQRLAAMKKYQFDYLGWVGRADAPALTFLLKSR